MKLDVNKIAILRANALGDFIFTLPALQALRETYPHAEIVLLGLAWHKSFLEHRPSPIDRVEIIPKIKGVNTSQTADSDRNGLQAFIKKLRNEKIDIALQLHGGGRYSNPFINSLNAGLTIGLQTLDAQPLDISVPYVYYQNEFLRYIEVVAKIGAKIKEISPTITVTRSDLTEASTVIPKVPYVVLHPGATDIRRRWNPKQFAVIGDAIYKKGYEVFITGNEINIVKSVLSFMHYPAYALGKKLSLGGLTGFLSQASLVISNDTGPLHLANAVRTPTVGIYWCANLINGGQITRELHRPAISWMIHCPFCGTNCAAEYPWNDQTICTHETSFVEAVSADEVLQYSTELLEQTEKRKQEQRKSFTQTPL